MLFTFTSQRGNAVGGFALVVLSALRGIAVVASPASATSNFGNASRSGAQLSLSQGKDFPPLVERSRPLGLPIFMSINAAVGFTVAGTATCYRLNSTHFVPVNIYASAYKAPEAEIRIMDGDII
jgi:hypothetical protein